MGVIRMGVSTASRRDTAFRALDATDDMPRHLRECVHEFGYAIVKAYVDNGVTDPRRIRYLVIETWRGARQPLQYQKGGKGAPRTGLLGQIDWIMIQNDAGISAATLVRVLWQSGFVIVHREPNDPMIRASMEEVSGFTERMTKPEKHRRRMRAAIAAYARKMWPHLFDGVRAA